MLTNDVTKQVWYRDDWSAEQNKGLVLAWFRGLDEKTLTDEQVQKYRDFTDQLDQLTGKLLNDKDEFITRRDAYLLNVTNLQNDAFAALKNDFQTQETAENFAYDPDAITSVDYGTA